MAKPIKSLELHYPMIQFLIKYYYSIVPFTGDVFYTSVYLFIYFIKYDTHKDKPFKKKTCLAPKQFFILLIISNSSYLKPIPP